MMNFMRALGKLENMNGFLVKNDVFSAAFCYVRYTMGMEELTNFGSKNSSTLPSLSNDYFSCLGDENDEPIYIPILL